MHDNIPKIDASTPNLAAERRAQLLEMFPEARRESDIDFSKLRELLGELPEEGSERYQFSWAGKTEALRLLQTPSRATLHPAPDESLDWDETQNLFIEGDNLEALKLLYKPLFGRVKMIYIDPPYNTGNDFIYPDNFADPLKNYLAQTGQLDVTGDLQTSNPDTAGRIHSRWLSMLYPRLYLARQLLKDDGVIFISIDDKEVHHLRLLMNQVFGEENFVAQIIWQKVYSPRMDDKGISADHDYILAYGRSVDFVPARLNFEQNLKQFTSVDEKSGKRYRPRSLRKEGKNSRRQDRPNLFYPLAAPDGTAVFPIKPDGAEGCWRMKKETYQKTFDDGLIEWLKVRDEWQPFVKQFYDEGATRPYSTVWAHTEAGHNHEAADELKALLGNSVFDNPKPTRLIKRLLKIGEDVLSGDENSDIILDFFSGSGTTAQAVLELNREDGGNRRYILVQLPEKTDNAEFPTIADITKERVRRVVARMKAAQNGTLDISTRETPEDLGFKVWKLGESNFRQMQPVDPGDTAAYVEQLALMNDALLPDSNPQSVIYEVALREGFSLNCAIKAHPEVAGVWRVSDVEKEQWFWLTLVPSLELEALRPLNLQADDLFICRGVALDDTTAANLALQCRLKMI